jgi:hypothetical protein
MAFGHLDVGGGHIVSELTADAKLPLERYPEEFARPGIDAFSNSDRRAQLSRSTQILVMAEQLTRSQPFDDSRLTSSPTTSMYAQEIELLQIPVVTSLERFDSSVGLPATEYSQAEATSLWRMAKDGDSLAAAKLIRDSMYDPSPVVQAAAAIGTIVLESASTDESVLLSRREMQLLRDLSFGRDTETRRLASTFVENAETPGSSADESEEREHIDPPLSHFTGLKVRHDPQVESLSSGVHGTFAHFSKGPMTPGSAFYNYLSNSIAGDLFPCFGHHFRWEGRYDARSQRNGADQLRAWANEYAQSGQMNIVFAHSHGGNVALNAAASGLHIRRLVLLSTPAQRRSTEEWTEINRNADRVISYRTHLDRVILADQLASRLPWGKQRRAPSDGLDFPANCGIIRPNPIGWLKHSKWLREDVWKSRGIADSVHGYID